jgi:hypothetical protein
LFWLSKEEAGLKESFFAINFFHFFYHKVASSNTSGLKAHAVKMFTQSLSKGDVVSYSQETFSQKETWTLTLLNVHCLCCSVISLVVHSLKCAFSFISSFDVGVSSFG